MALSQQDFKYLQQRAVKAREVRDREWRAHWIDCADYLLPRHGRFHYEGKERDDYGGGKKHRRLLNSTPTIAVNVAVSGFRGGLVPHSVPWFKLGFDDAKLAKFGPVRQWLDEVQTGMYRVFSGSNFYSAMHTVFYEMLAFGTAVAIEEEDTQRVARFRPWTAGEYALLSNQSGEVDTFFRWSKPTVRQVAQKFGKEAMSVSAQSMLDKCPDDTLPIVCAIFPREVYDRRKIDAGNMPFAVVYWEEGKDNVLLESGFSSRAAFAPRWATVADDCYASTWPGADILGDSMRLQKLERDYMEMQEKRNRPPMTAPATLKGRLSMLPNAINYVGQGEADSIKPLLQFQTATAAFREDIRDIETRIKQGLYNDLFLIVLQDKNMTATEVAQRHEDKLAILGAVIERMNSELLNPCIDRTFELMVKAGRVPPPPREIVGQQIKVEYVSILAQAQKLVATQNIDRFLGFVGGASQMFPDMVDLVDPDELGYYYGEHASVPAAIIRGKDDVAKIRKAKAEARQQQEAMAETVAMAQAANSAGGAARQFAEADKGGSALSQLLRG